MGGYGILSAITKFPRLVSTSSVYVQPGSWLRCFAMTPSAVSAENCSCISASSDSQHPPVLWSGYGGRGVHEVQRGTFPTTSPFSIIAPCLFTTLLPAHVIAISAGSLPLASATLAHETDDSPGFHFTSQNEFMLRKTSLSLLPPLLSEVLWTHFTLYLLQTSCLMRLWLASRGSRLKTGGLLLL